MAAGPSIQEYLVKLGVQLDESNLNKLMGFLKSGKVQAAALSAALVAAGTVIYKFIKSTTEMEFSLAQLAKKQKKTVETTRAQQNALKAMNKTAQEVSKDPSLKKIYTDLVKINKEMALPDTGKVLGTVRALQREFYALRSTVQYGLQWINYYLLQQLQEPIERIAGYIKKAREWLRINLKQGARTIALYISTFAKGLIGIFEAAGRIADLVNRLPDSVRGIGTAIIGVFALIKSGPLGQILMVVEAVGGLIHDYENWQWNQNNKDKPQVEIAFPSIWELLSGDGSSSDKAKGVVGLVTDALGEGAKGLASGITEWITSHKDDFSAVSSAILDAVKLGIETASGLGAALVDAFTTVATDEGVKSSISGLLETLIGSAFELMGGIGGTLVQGILSALAGKNSEEWQAEFPEGEGNTVLGGLGSALVAHIFGADAKASLLTGLVTFLSNSFSDGELKSSAYHELKTAGEMIWAGIKEGLNDAATIVNDVTTVIGSALTGVSTADWDAALGENNAFVTGLGTTLITKAFGASWGQSALAGIGGALADAFADTGSVSGALSKTWEDLKAVGKTVWGKITEGFGKFTEWWNGSEGEQFKADLKKTGDWIADELFGAKGENGKRTGGLFESMKNILGDIIGVIKESELYTTIADIIKNAVTDAVNSLWSLIQPSIEALWASILASMPGWLKSFLGISEVTTFTSNGDGNMNFTSSNGNTFRYTESENGAGMSMTDVLTANKDLLSPTSTGKIKFAMTEDVYKSLDAQTAIQLSQALNTAISGGDVDRTNALLTGYRNYQTVLGSGIPNAPMDALNALKAAIDGNTAALEANKPPVSEQGSGDSYVDKMRKDIDAAKGYSTMEIPDNDAIRGYYTLAMKEFNGAQSAEQLDKAVTMLGTVAEKIAQYNRNNGGGGGGTENAGSTATDVKVNGQGIKDQVKNAVETSAPQADVSVDGQKLRTKIRDAIKAGSPYNIDTKTSAMKNAMGGRFDSPTYGEFGEDGTEYIIPITKPSRAISLILQMLGEMGRNATESIMSALGLSGDTSTYGGNWKNIQSLTGGRELTINYYNNVTAPVSITVQPGTASAQETGNYVYNLAQRSQLRAIQGVLA